MNRAWRVDRKYPHHSNPCSPFLLDGGKMVIPQTPGRLQYYRAENLPFLPDEAKWAIRFPNQFAIRELTLAYEDTVQKEI